ncbi:MAG: pilus assembly PilX family protein [Gammaproteobacteria bacterium]|nr:PilX N-terminal domain-containing pilus assembly protein [Gammaproteobacteria bacterium]
MNRKQVCPLRAQAGSALIVSLLILIVLTVLGVAAMSTNSLEEKMAGNTRQSDLAFQSAESALRDGEIDLSTNNPTGYNSACTSGLCLPSTTGISVWQTVNWATNARAYGAYTGAAALAGVPKPAYIIEQMPPAVTPGCNLGQTGTYNNGPCSFQVYRITARGTGPDGTAVAMLQEAYKP